MSAKQWGHGYRTAVRKHSPLDLVVGKDDEGNIDFRTILMTMKDELKYLELAIDARLTGEVLTADDRAREVLAITRLETGFSAVVHREF
ncbi:MAG: hypothetical protein Q8K57_13385 [Thiobacillus sp.]|nr:hypothetical protein [Thiobacillus sp.]MDP1925761.1 hypothetical protein [Thiobacillus sp.]